MANIGLVPDNISGTLLLIDVDGGEERMPPEGIGWLVSSFFRLIGVCIRGKAPLVSAPDYVSSIMTAARKAGVCPTIISETWSHQMTLPVGVSGLLLQLNETDQTATDAIASLKSVERVTPSIITNLDLGRKDFLEKVPEFIRDNGMSQWTLAISDPIADEGERGSAWKLIHALWEKCRKHDVMFAVSDPLDYLCSSEVQNIELNRIPVFTLPSWVKVATMTLDGHVAQIAPVKEPIAA